MYSNPASKYQIPSAHYIKKNNSKKQAERSLAKKYIGNMHTVVIHCQNFRRVHLAISPAGKNMLTNFIRLKPKIINSKTILRNSLTVSCIALYSLYKFTTNDVIHVSKCHQSKAHIVTDSRLSPSTSALLTVQSSVVN